MEFEFTNFPTPNPIEIKYKKGSATAEEKINQNHLNILRIRPSATYKKPTCETLRLIFFEIVSIAIFIQSTIYQLTVKTHLPTNFFSLKMYLLQSPQQ